MLVVMLMTTMVLMITKRTMTTMLKPEASEASEASDYDYLRHRHSSIGQEGTKGESRKHGKEGGKELRRKIHIYLQNRSQKRAEKKENFAEMRVSMGWIFFIQ